MNHKSGDVACKANKLMPLFNSYFYRCARGANFQRTCRSVIKKRDQTIGIHYFLRLLLVKRYMRYTLPFVFFRLCAVYIIFHLYPLNVSRCCFLTLDVIRLYGPAVLRIIDNVMLRNGSVASAFAFCLVASCLPYGPTFTTSRLL